MTAATDRATASKPRAHIRQHVLIRRVFNPLVVRLRLSPTLIVRGRRSGKQRSVPFDGPFEYEGRRYLVSPMGDSYWARNLRAAGEAELRIRRQREQIRVVEMQDPERSAIVKAYAASLTCNCRTYMARLPNPADHPVFRIDPPDEVVDHGAQLGP